MSSADKKTYLIPKAFFAVMNRAYVLFDIKVIPKDLLIKKVALHLPLPKVNRPCLISIKRILRPWHEKQLIAGNYPPLSKTILSAKLPKLQGNITISVSDLVDKWRKKRNHGLCIQANSITMRQDQLPYLEIDAI